MQTKDYIDQVLEYMLIEPNSVEIREDENDDYIFVLLDVVEEDAGKLIGKYGDTLNGLSHLATVSCYDSNNEKRVVVDVNDYKFNRETEAEEIAVEAAEEVLESQRPRHLPKSWQAHQRRVVHQRLQDFAGVFTESEGEGRDRHLVIYPEGWDVKNKKDDSQRDY